MSAIVATTAALSLVAAAPHGAAGDLPEPGKGRARLAACATGAAAADRAAAFTASMRAVPGTRRMAVRFDLLRRADGARAFAPIPVPGLGVWQRSRFGRTGFAFTQRVGQLAAPSAYRAVVRFRWLGAGGRLLRSDRRTTTICMQPDPRADLRAGRLTATAGAAGTATYRLVIRNRGASAAPASSLVATIGAALAPQASVGVAALAGRAATVVAFTAPACQAGESVVLRLDAADEVDESAEADNVLVRPCPAGDGRGAAA